MLRLAGLELPFVVKDLAESKFVVCRASKMGVHSPPRSCVVAMCLLNSWTDFSPARWSSCPRLRKADVTTADLTLR
jgi:hypothetical protein